MEALITGANGFLGSALAGGWWGTGIGSGPWCVPGATHRGSTGPACSGCRET